MRLEERDFVVGGAVIGKIPYYADVEPELMQMKKGDRVLPAQYFYEKRVHYELFAIHEPGVPGFPKGGIEVTGMDGHRRYYDLDQVILHPHVIKHKKTLEKMMKKAEKESAKRMKQYEKAQRKAEKAGKRGRKALSPEERAQREADKAARALKSGGRRGRPKGSGSSTPKVYVPTGGKRGRRPLDPEVLAARAREKAARSARSGGKRGRPKRK